MSNIYGIWKHQSTHEGSSTEMTQTIREDGSYETHMVFAMGGCCHQHIYHYGTLEIGGTTLKLNFGFGKTEMKECEILSSNFEIRDFTEAETKEAKSLLEQELPYVIDRDKLTMRVSSPMGEMEVVYDRQAE